MDKILWIQFFLPLFCAISFFMAPLSGKSCRIFSLIGSICYFLASLNLVNSVDSLSSLTILSRIELDNFFGLTYTFALDGLSAVLVLLNALLLIIVITATWNFETNKYRLYYFSIFSLVWAVNGSLLSINLFSFYIFWEVMLIPLFLLIGVFGGKNRKYASYKFFIFTASGSILLLGAMMYMSSLNFNLTGSYDLTPQVISQLNLPFDGFFSPQSLVFWAFCIAFFIKVPVFPFHSWLPDAHVEAPTAGSIILAGVLLKLGIYGLLRFVIPLFPDAVIEYQKFIMILGAVGVIYGALTALAQDDIKKVVAYSSISHMGYIIAGIFSLNKTAINGSIFQMVSHGLTTGGLFVAVHCLYIRRYTKMINQFGGIAKVMPVFAVFFFLLILGSMAVPLTNGFVGEFLIIFGVYEVDRIIGAVCAFGVILGPVYLLTLFQKTMLGPITIEENKSLKDIGIMEMVPFVILGFLILFYGVYPTALTDIYESIIPNIVDKNLMNNLNVVVK